MTCDFDEDGGECYDQCRASRGDGECIWKDCPQAKDYQPICPLAKLCAVHDRKDNT